MAVNFSVRVIPGAQALAKVRANNDQ